MRSDLFALETADLPRSAGATSAESKPVIKPMGVNSKLGKNEVLQQLERIVASAEFVICPRSRGFLRYVVEAHVEGRESEISQHAIAGEVFGRNSDFDPTVDPIVRIQAGRVRRSLDHYYLTEGVNDPVLISLPKGTYIPACRHRHLAETPPSLAGGIAPPSARTDLWPTLLLTPFRNLTSDPALEPIAHGLGLELASELNSYQELRFLLGTPAEDCPAAKIDAQYELRGALSNGGSDLKISVQLLSCPAAGLLWAHTYSADRSAPDLNAAFEEVAQTIAATIAGERGMLARHTTEQRAARQDKVALGAYEALQRYHQFVTSPSPEAYCAALTALQTAVRDHPDCGCCWSFLGRLCAEDYALGISGDPQLIQNALVYAHKGVQLSPTDQRARGVLSYAYLLNDQVGEARREAEAALAINPHSLFVLDGIGYLLTLSGDWERGPELSRKAIRLNPFHLPVVHAGLWLDALRRNDFQEAYWQSLEFSPPEIFWHPLMQAVAQAFLGRTDEAAVAAGQILKLRPDFSASGRQLIRHYVKFEPLVGQIEDGLAKAGLPLTPL